MHKKLALITNSDALFLTTRELTTSFAHLSVVVVGVAHDKVVRIRTSSCLFDLLVGRVHSTQTNVFPLTETTTQKKNSRIN